MHGSVPALHILTNDVVLADPGFVQVATAVMEAWGPRIAIHLRATEITARRLVELSLLTVVDARRIAPTIVLGASVHATADAWITAQSGATFLVAGPPGDVKSEQAELSQFVRDVVDAAEGCPVIAIGGMTPERAYEMSRSGASGIAAMRGIWLDDAVSATHRYLASYDEGLRR